MRGVTAAVLVALLAALAGGCNGAQMVNDAEQDSLYHAPPTVSRSLIGGDSRSPVDRFR
jgi:hypothetical protein